MAETETTDQQESRWPNLTRDVLALILKRLTTSSEITRFRSICKTWRSFASPPSSHTLFPLPLPPLQPSSKPISLSPTLYSILSPKPTSQKTQQKNFWVAKVNEKGANLWALLNPLTNHKLYLPSGCLLNGINLLEFGSYEVGRCYSMLTVGSDQKGGTFDSFDFDGFASLIDHPKVVVDLGEERLVVLVSYRYEKIGVWEEGKKDWRFFKSDFGDVVCFDGKFYAVDRKGRLGFVDFSTFELVEEVAALVDVDSEYCYLVESGFKLYLVVKVVNNSKPIPKYDEEEDEWVVDHASMSRPLGFKIFVFNQREKVWERVESLGDRVFFVSRDAAFSIRAEDLGWKKGNCVYFEGVTGYDDEADMVFGLNAGVYSLEDKAITIFRSLDDPKASIFKPPSGWFKQGEEYPDCEMMS